MSEHRILGTGLQRIAEALDWLLAGFRDGLPAALRRVLLGDERVVDVMEDDGRLVALVRSWPGALPSRREPLLPDARGRLPRTVRSLLRRRPVRLVPPVGAVLAREITVPAAAAANPAALAALNFEAWTAFAPTEAAWSVRLIGKDEATARLALRFVPLAVLRPMIERLGNSHIAPDLVVLDPAEPAVPLAGNRLRRFRLLARLDAGLVLSAVTLAAVLLAIEHRAAVAARDAGLAETAAVLAEAKRTETVKSKLSARRTAVEGLVKSLQTRETTTEALVSIVARLPEAAEVETLDWEDGKARLVLRLPPDAEIAGEPGTRAIALGETDDGRRRLEWIVAAEARP